MKARHRKALACLAGLTMGAAVGVVPSTAAGAAPKGEPIYIGVIYNEDQALGQSNEQVGDALRAAIKAQAAKDGLNGHPVKLVVCTNKSNDPNGGAACANKMVDNEKIVAVVGSANSEGDTINPILQEAGIPIIASAPISTADLMTPNAFPVSSGALGTPGAATVLTDKANVDSIALANLDLAAAAQLPVIFDLALADRGTKLVGEVKLPLEKQDFSAEAAQLADLGDGIVVMSLPEQFGRLLRAGKSTGTWDGKEVATASSIATEDVIKSLGPDANGIYVVTGGLATTDIKKPGVKRYLREIRKYGDASTVQDDLVKNAWLGYQVFSAAVKDQPTIDRASLLAALQQLTYDSQGMAPPLDFTKPNTTVLGGAVPRAFNTSVMYAKVKDGGKIVSIDPNFVNPFEAT